MCNVTQWNNLKLVVIFFDVSIYQMVFVEQKAVIWRFLAHFLKDFKILMYFVTFCNDFEIYVNGTFYSAVNLCLYILQVHFCLKISMLEGSLIVIE